MAIAFAQVTVADIGPSPRTVPWAVDQTFHSLLVATCWWDSAAMTCTVTDSNGGSWAPLGSPQTGAGGLSTWRIQFFYAYNVPAGANTMTATLSGAGNAAVGILEFTGMDTSSPLDAGPTYQNVVSANPTNTALATTAADTALVSFSLINDSAVGPPYVDAPWVVDLSATFSSNPLAHRIVSSAGSYSATSHQASATDAIIGIVAFKAPAAAPPGTTTLRPVTSGLRW